MGCARFSLDLPAIRLSVTPYTPQSPQVEGAGQQGPFGSDVAQTTQQEPPYSLLLLDDPEDGFDQVLSPFERSTSLLRGIQAR